MVLEPRFAEAAGPFGLDDLRTVGVQLDVIAHAAAKGACRILDDGQTHLMSRLVDLGWRPDRAAPEMFSPGRGRGNCRGCAAACTGRSQSLPTPALLPSRRDRLHQLPRQVGWGPWLLPYALGASSGSTSTSQPFEVGMPVPSVVWP